MCPLLAAVSFDILRLDEHTFYDCSKHESPLKLEKITEHQIKGQTTANKKNVRHLCKKFHFISLSNYEKNPNLKKKKVRLFIFEKNKGEIVLLITECGELTSKLFLSLMRLP